MALSRNIPEVNRTINNILLHEYGTITSTLARRLGQENLIHIDDLVYNTVNAAKVQWSASQIPNDPRNTLWQFVTDNTSDLFCKKLRYRDVHRDKHRFEARNLYYPDSAESDENKVTMLFTCCHPAIDEQCRVYLILKILCGFSNSYISRVFSRNESHVSEEIYNAKKSIIEQKIPMNIPVFNFDKRLELVRDALLRIFENGRNPSNERLKIVPELCYVSINLARVLSSYHKTSIPEVYAQVSMMLFKAARLGASVDEKGNILTLKEQDRSKWDYSMISEALEYLDRSASGDFISRMHLRAGVSAVHSLSRDYMSTNWDRIIDLYDKYLNLNNEPDIEVERAIAISKARGPAEGLRAIRNMGDYSSVTDKKQYHTTLGNLYFQIHQYSMALSSYRNALDHTTKPNDKNFILNKMAICEQRIEMM